MLFLGFEDKATESKAWISWCQRTVSSNPRSLVIILVILFMLVHISDPHGFVVPPQNWF